MSNFKFTNAFLRYIGCGIFTAALLCSPNKPTNGSPYNVVPGMRKINSLGKSFLQGADDSLASLADLEKPPMTTYFSYDFWIDTVEVTQNEYQIMTEKQPVLASSKFGCGPQFPVYFVSWYDAVLFCNAKSKRFNLDTVYFFSSSKISPSGSVYELTGLHIDLQKNGCRLPTEAEWEFAAKAGIGVSPLAAPADSQKALSMAWYGANCSGAAHPVASLRPNPFGLYDMAGNVYEWTNDWKGPYCVNKITDPIGAPLADDADQRVLKGGSFAHGYLYLRPSRRGAPYAITLSTAAEFIGFRCAWGPIPGGGKFVSSDTQPVPATNTAELLQSELRPGLGSSRAKLVFVNITGTVHTLCLVDFSKAHPFVYEFPDRRSVYVPTISPDGRFAAFCDRGEGLSGNAKIFIRSLDSLTKPAWDLGADSAFVPRWWVERTSADTFLVYVNSSIDDKAAQWRETGTFLQKMTGGKPTGPRRPLIPQGGAFHDGISRDGRFIVTGFSRCIMHDLQTGAERQLFTAPFNGKDSAGSTQVCNVSISPDSAFPDRCLFLDFGYPKTSALIKTPYGVHEYLFMAQYSGTVLQWLKRPAGESAWDNPEWSNNPRYAAACGVDAADNAHAVYAIDLDNATSVKLVQAPSLAFPFLWIDGGNQDSIQFSHDSCAAYYDPPLNAYEGIFSFKMHLFWKMHSSLEAVFVGNSQVINGIDCSKLKSVVSLNMSVPGSGLATAQIIIQNYVLNHCPSIKLISMGSAVCWMANPGDEDGDIWGQSIAESKGLQFDANHNYWSNGLPAGFEAVATSRPFFSCCNIDSFGFAAGFCQNWGGSSPNQYGRTDWTTGDSICNNNVHAIEHLGQQLAAKKIHFLMINYPMSPAYKTTPLYGAGGPLRATGDSVIEQLKKFQANNPYFHFYDAYRDGDHDYTDEQAQDYDHLCPVGAAKLTARIDSLVEQILSR